MEGWHREGEADGRMQGGEDEEELEEERGCGRGRAAWLTGLVVAGWLAVTDNLRQSFSPGNTHTLKHT